MKKLLLSFCLLCSFGIANAQLSYHGNVGIGFFKNSETYGSFINYSPRLNITELNEDTSISINALLGVSYAFSINLLEVDFPMGIDLPIFVAYNFGSGATYTSKKDFGGHIGIGYSFSSFAYLEKLVEGIDTGAGLYTSIGTRFYLEGETVGITFSYAPGSGNNKNIMALSFVYYAGDY